MGGLTPEIEQEILNLIRDKSIEYVAIDSSLLGRLSEVIKNESPSCRIMVFFHNTEYYYFKSLMVKTRKVWHYISVRAARYNEELACRYADDLITLNQRDADDLKKVYGRKECLVIPVVYMDRFDRSKITVPHEPVALFVGTLFFPNYYGIKWFIEKVQPYIHCKLIIVGKGFEQKRNELSSQQVEVIGTAEDIDQYYYRSSFVVAPIFDGSGMKTKTAEALMFGKHIFGTQEAFEGYDMDIFRIGACCNSPDDFIRAINEFIENKKISAFNEYSRTTFLENHDYQNALVKFRAHISPYIVN